MSDQPQADGPAQKEFSGRIGKYDIVRVLGKGAMGQVYLARDSMLDRDVALKVMISNIADDPELKIRFEREAKAVARMSHPNVVNVYDLGYHTDGSPYMAMELLKGSDLQKAMRQTPPLALDRKVNVIVQVLSGLAHAHQAGIVHRDIKPANIFLNDDGSVKIMDFGVARLTTASMTGTGSIVGTADYMSPEQVRGAKVDGRSDLFSVGCMFYELLSGRRPFRAENLMAIFYKITHEDPDFNMIPEGEDYDALMPVLKRSLSKSLDERYATAYDFATDLKDFLRTRATSSSSAEHALEGLVDLEPPPTGGPQPMTDYGDSGATVVEGDAGGTVDVSRARPPSGAPTVRGTSSPTVAGHAARGGVAPTVLQPGPRSSTVARPGPRPLPAQGPAMNPAIYAALGVGLLALAGVGYVLWNQLKPKPEPPPTTLAAAPPTTLPPPTTLATPVPTPEAPPSFTPPVGKAAAALRGAQAAFRQGDYDRAVSQAQSALREDPGNGDAQKLLENAMNGQRASSRFAAAEAALKQGDFDKAQSEADGGRQLAAWDARAPDLLTRIREAQRRAAQQAEAQKEQQVAAELSAVISQGDQALSAQKYDQAIALYDQALAKDPTNQRATLGKTSAVAAKAVSQAAARTAVPPPPAGKRFAVGKTEATSSEQTSGAVPAGFEVTAGVAAKSATQAADLPGSVTFDLEPDSPKPNEKYTVVIRLQNSGSAPIQIQIMSVTTVINGRRSSGAVPPLAKEVAPRQTATLLSLPDVWKDDTTSWSMEVTVRTARGETYKNKVEWK